MSNLLRKTTAFGVNFKVFDMGILEVREILSVRKFTILKVREDKFARI